MPKPVVINVAVEVQPNVLANEAAALELFNTLVMSSADFDKPAIPILGT